MRSFYLHLLEEISVIKLQDTLAGLREKLEHNGEVMASEIQMKKVLLVRT